MKKRSSRIFSRLTAILAVWLAVGSLIPGMAGAVSPLSPIRAQAAVVRPLYTGVTIDEYLGCTTYPEDWLDAHFWDGYYLGTPYRGLDSYTGSYPTTISRFNGDVIGDGACNCAGVPSALMRNCGGDLSRIRSYGSGSYVNATNWKNTILNNKHILCYHFKTMDEALDSGLVRRGDLFYLDPISWDLPDIDCHIGVLWPDDPRHNMAIHSVPPDVQYSPVAFSDEAFTYYVFPTRHRDLKSYADPNNLYGVFDALYYALANPDLLNAFGLDVPLLYYHYTNAGVYEGRRGSLVFDPDYYRAIIGGSRSNWLAELKSFQTQGMAAGIRGSAEFDPAYYRRHNPDLEAAFGNNWRAYYVHFMQAGVWEGRKGSAEVDFSDPAIFDAKYYLNRYPDLRAAFGNDEAAALRHFETSGVREGRVGCASFDVRSYRLRYPDLRAAFGDDLTQYYVHYLKCGRAEGRDGSTWADFSDPAIFNAQYYLDHNPDLRAAFGTDAAAALTHFETYGIREGRVASASFDVNAYRAANQDLNAVFGDDMAQYYVHYLQYGRAEGRTVFPAAEGAM